LPSWDKQLGLALVAAERVFGVFGICVRLNACSAERVFGSLAERVFG
jgi:hypothetical protein